MWRSSLGVKVRPPRGAARPAARRSAWQGCAAALGNPGRRTRAGWDVSQNDSFIDEVTDELRRDRLTATFRRWAWLGALLVVLVVGGAAANEWRLARAAAEAQARGDALLAAQDDADALAAIAAADPAGGVAALLSGEAGALAALAADPEADPLYRDLAQLRLASDPDAEMDDDARRAALAAIAAPGAPYRVLAEEQIALIDARAGDAAGAAGRLAALAQDPEAGPGLRRRAGQLVLALGGGPEAEE